MSNVFLTRMPTGIPGAVSRLASATLEPNFMGSTSIAYGSAVKIKDGKVFPLESGDDIALVYGFLVRPYPTSDGSNAFGVANATANTMQDVMRRGYMTVLLKTGSASKAGQVYIRTTGDVGAIEAASGADVVALPECMFMGEADAGGNVELSFKI